MLFNSHISAYAKCLAGKVCRLVRSTWGIPQVRINLGLEIRYLLQRERAGHVPGVRRANIPPL